jgi:hypothetical protein
MADNPFSPPTTQARSGAAAGQIVIGEIFTAGIEAFTRNPGSWIGALLIYAVATALSLLFCFVPVLIVGPVMYAGYCRMMVEGLHKDPSFDTLTEGFNDIGGVLFPMFGVMFLIGVVMIPGIFANILGSVAQIALADEPALGLLAYLGGVITGTLYNVVVMARLQPAIFLVAVDKVSPVDAISEAWSLTEGQWLTLCGLTFLMNIFAQLGILLCFVGVFITAAMVALMQAAVFAKLTGKPIKP